MKKMLKQPNNHDLIPQYSYVVRMAIIKMRRISKCDRIWGKRQSLCTTSGNINWCSHCRIQLRHIVVGRRNEAEGKSKGTNLES